MGKYGENLETMLTAWETSKTKIILEVTQVGRMYKIARYVPMNHPVVAGGFIGEETYHGFKKAKTAMRETVLEKFGVGFEGYINKIDEYCHKYYPDNIPLEFEKLKTLLTDFFSDTAFPQTEETIEQKYGWIDFSDERVYIGFEPDLLYFDEDDKIKTVPTLSVGFLADDGDKEVFIEGLINCFSIIDLPDDSVAYRCWLSAGVYYGLDIEMTLLSEDEE